MRTARPARARASLIVVLVQLLVGAILVAASPKKPQRRSPASPPAPTAPARAATPAPPEPREVVDLYVAVGRELRSLAEVQPLRTIDLWPRYRWIRIHDALVDARKRAVIADLLARLRAEVRAATP